MIPPHLQDQIGQQVKDTQEQALISASLPAVERPAGIFLMHGHEWTRHAPGHPMPCERKAKVAVLCRDNDALNAEYAGYWHWDKAPHEENEEIIGWRYATPQAEPLPVEDEIATLRAEKAEMLAAIREAHEALLSTQELVSNNDIASEEVMDSLKPVIREHNFKVHKAVDLTASALAKLKPFLL